MLRLDDSGKTLKNFSLFSWTNREHPCFPRSQVVLNSSKLIGLWFGIFYVVGSDYNGNNIGSKPEPKPKPEPRINIILLGASPAPVHRPNKYGILLGASAAPVPQPNINKILFGSKHEPEPEPEAKAIPTTTHTQSTNNMKER